jgi:hypothetical protein
MLELSEAHSHIGTIGGRRNLPFCRPRLGNPRTVKPWHGLPSFAMTAWLRFE